MVPRDAAKLAVDGEVAPRPGAAAPGSAPEHTLEDDGGSARAAAARRSNWLVIWQNSVKGQCSGRVPPPAGNVSRAARFEAWELLRRGD